MLSKRRNEDVPVRGNKVILAEEETLPKCLRWNFLKYPEKVAMRVKDRGIWQSATWKECYEKVKFFCMGLTSLGLERGDKVSILGENKPEWYWAELATQAAGGTAVGIFTDCVPSEVKYYVEHSDSKFVVAHDQEQVDKLLEIKGQLPQLEKVIYWEPKGLWNYDDPILMSFDDVLELGRIYEEDHPTIFDEQLDLGKKDDIAVICYTSGTTDLPKGAMLSHWSLVEAQRQLAKFQGWFGKEGYQYVSFIPPAWYTEQITGVAALVATQVIVNFPEEPETVQEDIREIGPDLLFYGARMWESVNRIVQAKMKDSTFLRRLLYKSFLPVVLNAADIQIRGKQVSLFRKILYFVAYQAIFRQLRDRLGLTNVKVAITGGGAMSPEIVRYFQAIGIELMLLYALTEAGVVSHPKSGEIRPESSGKPTPWVDLKLSNEGEILVKSQFMFSGYHKNPEAMQKKFKDGWYCTGDFGYIDGEGHLIVMDRMDDLKPLADGKKFSPQYEEARLRFSPFIKDVLVVGGEERVYVGSLVNIDIENVGRYAEANRIPYTTFADLSQKPEVIELIKKEIAYINRTIPNYGQIRKFVNIHKEFDADEAELTRTRKIRRAFVEERYRDLIAALYSDQNEIIIESPVTYRDGRKGVTKTTVKINTVD